MIITPNCKVKYTNPIGIITNAMIYDPQSAQASTVRTFDKGKKLGFLAFTNWFLDKEKLELVYYLFKVNILRRFLFFSSDAYF